MVLTGLYDLINSITVILFFSLIIFIVAYYMYQAKQKKKKIHIGGHGVRLFLIYITWMLFLLFGDLYFLSESLFLKNKQLIIIFSMLVFISFFTTLIFLAIILNYLKKKKWIKIKLFPLNRILDFYFIITSSVLLLIYFLTA